jgi:hypothetical protein
MSRNLNSKKPYCKVCHDAGKPESEYTNHWVRSLPDRSGNTTVICPTLLSNECRYCFKLGHTAKFCPVIEKNKKDRDRAERQVAHDEKVKIEKNKPAKRGFAALQEDSDSEVEKNKVTTIIVDEFPALCAPSNSKMAVSVKTETKTGWAAVAAKPKMVPVVEDQFIAQLEERSMIKNLPQSAMRPARAERNMSKEIYTRNWADWSDSDSEDEEWQSSASAFVKDTMPNIYNDNDISVSESQSYDSDW